MIEAEASRLHYSLRRLGKLRKLTREEEASLATEIRGGSRKALHKLVRENIPFAIAVACSYRGQGMPLDDLIQEATIGLINAAQKFDEKKNFRFISYAVWWARQRIMNALGDQSRIVRIPLTYVGLIQKATRARERMEQAAQRDVSSSEVSSEIDIPIERVSVALEQRADVHVSIHQPLRCAETCSIEDTLESDSPLPDESAEKKSLAKFIRKQLKLLPERQREALCLRYGIDDDGEPRSLQEVGKHLGCTHERARQLSNSGIDKLRNIMPAHEVGV